MANASDPHVVWAAQPATRHVGDARAPLALATPRRARSAARSCTGPTTGSTCSDRATSRSPRRRTGSTATTSCSADARDPAAARAARRVEPVERRARDHRGGRRTSGSIPSARPTRLRDGRDRRRPLHAACRSPDGRDGARVPRQEPGRLVRGPALARRRAGRRVVIAVNARVADGKDPSWLWDVPYELLRGRPVAARRRTRASTSRCGCGTPGSSTVVEARPDRAPRPRSPATSRDCSCTYTQFSALYRRFGDGAVSRPCASGSSTPSCSAPTATAATRSCSSQRCRWRGHPAELVEIAAGDADPRLARHLPLRRRRGRRRRRWPPRGMRAVAAPHRARAAGGAVVFAVCAGFQLIGTSYDAADGDRARRPRPRRPAVTGARIAPPDRRGRGRAGPSLGAPRAHRLREPRRAHHPRPRRRARSAG